MPEDPITPPPSSDPPPGGGSGAKSIDPESIDPESSVQGYTAPVPGDIPPPPVDGSESISKAFPDDASDPPPGGGSGV
ncbi:MAG TPA: hypothetical protein VGC66_07435 [Pyrinomonadaceae bacterium]|jgi:hypothetical protein